MNPARRYCSNETEMKLVPKSTLEARQLVFIVLNSEVHQFQRFELLLRLLLKNVRLCSHFLSVSSISKSNLWLTVSKDFDKSRNTFKETLLSSNDLNDSQVRSEMASIVDRYFKIPQKIFIITSCLSKKIVILEFTTFSNIFYIVTINVRVD